VLLVSFIGSDLILGRAKGESPYRVSIEIVNKECKILRLLKDLGIPRFTVLDVRRLRRGVSRHLVRISRGDLNKVTKHSSVKLKNSVAFGDEATAWFETEGCNVCNTIISKGAFLMTAWSVGEDKFIYTFVAPNPETAQDIISILESLNFKPRVLGIGRYSRRTSLLTEKQEVALWLALETGFFDHPKKIGIVELSRRLKISPSTLSEILRRGMRRLLENYFETI